DLDHGPALLPFAATEDERHQDEEEHRHARQDRCVLSRFLRLLERVLDLARLRLDVARLDLHSLPILQAMSSATIPANCTADRLDATVHQADFMSCAS